MRRGCSLWLGRVGYDEALAFQRKLLEARIEDRAPDTLLLLEHPPVITLGKVSRSEHLRHEPSRYAEMGIELREVDRGGDVTWHGPGQLVGYPIFDLRSHRKDVKWYLEAVEAALIDALRSYGITAERTEGMTGAWVDERKIAAIGVRVERWTTCHGFALNVKNDLRAFDLIIPCGIRDRGVTSVTRELSRDVELADVAQTVSQSFSRVFGLEISHEEKPDQIEAEEAVEKILSGEWAKDGEPGPL